MIVFSSDADEDEKNKPRTQSKKIIQLKNMEKKISLNEILAKLNKVTKNNYYNKLLNKKFYKN